MKKLLVALMALACTVFIAGCASDTPEEVAVKFIRLVYEGETKSALKLVQLPDDFQDEGELQKLQNGKLQAYIRHAHQKTQQRGGIRNITVVNQAIDEPNGEGQISLVVNFKNEGSKSERETVKLVRQKDKWMVDL